MKLPRPHSGGARWLNLGLLAMAPWLAVHAMAASSAPEMLPAKFAEATPLEWSVRMAKSQMARQPAAPRWDYASGLFALSLLQLGEKTGDPVYSSYAEKLTGSCVNAEGVITGYRMDEYTLDNIASGKVLLALYAKSPDARYLTALQTLRRQLAQQPRTASGGFWHKQVYPQQMWLDGLYMAGPFYAQYGKVFNEPADLDDVSKQILLATAHTYDTRTGLFYHGWDESSKMFWANPETGLSASFWGRAEGWLAMALVDCLDFFPENHPQRAKIIEVLTRLADGVVKWQDPKTGLWWQVLDQGPREGNYLEATASCQFVYALAKAVNHGYLPRAKYLDAISRGYAGIIRDLVTTNADGSINLTQCCSVAGLGGSPSNGHPRDGTFAYYISERVVSNDLKGGGPFILAGLEMAALQDSPTTETPSLPATSSSATTSTSALPDLTTAEVAKLGWDALPQILAHLQAPVFPDKNFPITDFGGHADGMTDNTDAIRRAIEACHNAGGGHVIIPDGVTLTGAVHLLSNVDLHLHSAASTLKFVYDRSKYPLVLTRYEGVEVMNYSPLIYAYEQQNIAVTGDGTLDGSSSRGEGWLSGAFMNSGLPDKRDPPIKAEQGVPVAERIYGDKGALRPNFFQPYRCTNVLIEGVRVRNSPMWEIHPVLCTNVIVRGLDINCLGANNDGCDPESCKYVLIENCSFATGDDCIAIKAGKNADGRRVNVPCEFVVIRQCLMPTGHGSITMGSECTGGIRNVFAENCRMDSASLTSIVRFKNNAGRGGTIENIYVRNLDVGRIGGTSTAALSIQYAYAQDPEGSFIPVLRNVNLTNIKCANIPRVVSIEAVPTAVIEGIHLDNCVMAGADPAALLQYPGLVTFNNVTILPAGADIGAPVAQFPAAPAHPTP